MNLYFGRKNAAYVRPTPKMSQVSSLHSEYYREEFDPTFYPLIYKMVNQLTDQAEHFQKCCDPIYDRFLFDSLSRENPEIHQFPKQDGYNRNETKKYMQNRRFCALSIMTCGNSTISGFANEPHKDNDFITTSCYYSCHQTLKQLHREVTTSENEQLYKALSHIKKRFKKNNKFSTYTTCGYKCKFTESLNKQVLAFFIYNDFQIAVSIPNDNSCYHTFNASFCHHHTSVPITHDKEKVYFSDNDLFLFA